MKFVKLIFYDKIIIIIIIIIIIYTIFIYILK
jgi:hypothetical protein